MKRIAICGATGLVGSLLTAKLLQRGDQVIVVGRGIERLRRDVPDATDHLTWEEFASAETYALDSIVNLAGAGVMDRRWTEAYKAIMTQSRVKSTQICANICAKHPAIQLSNASSVHAYGVHAGDHKAFVEGDEPSDGKNCYLYELYKQWEAATAAASTAGARVVNLRIGVVLASEGGALAETVKPFKVFLGGRHGTGRQILSWISLRDLANAIIFLIDKPEITGPVNMVSPNPCTNAGFTAAIGAALGKPDFVPMPSSIVRAVMGQAGHELVLLGQRVLPMRLLEAGFEFEDDCIDRSVDGLLNPGT
ncbi:MAG: TIGR01777 family oxidoreductase [Pseudomonadota bacterium]